MRRSLLFVCALAFVFAFASPALAQEATTPETPEATQPGSVGQDQYDDRDQQQNAIQSVEEGMEEALDHAEKNRDAVEGAQAYMETRSPERAQAEEPKAQQTPEAQEAPETLESAQNPASSVYQQLPDTGGPALLLPFAGTLAVLLAGGALLRVIRN